MSEYQYVAFRAIDAPVTEKNLEYMERQSSRAEITPWSFDNEYHYGDFHGNAVEMLRRGYDLHLHYANFGTRTLMIRLPDGLPDSRAAKPYFGKDGLKFVKDKRGPGGTIVIDPYDESGELDLIWDIADVIDELVALRDEILSGDLRSLYLAHLAVACDGNHDPDETTEGPVPGGLTALTDAQVALTELYGLDESLIAAAARSSPSLPARTVRSKQHTAWLSCQRKGTKDAWLAKLMADPHSTVRKEVLSAFQKDNPAISWPVVSLNRTVAELREAADEVVLKISSTPTANRPPSKRAPRAHRDRQVR
jgi:hypothetical protein